MDFTREDLQALQAIAEKCAKGDILEKVTVTIVEDGQEKQLTFTDPLMVQCFQKAALEVHRKYNFK